MPSSDRDAGALAPVCVATEGRMRVQDRTRAPRGNNVIFSLNPIDRRRPYRMVAAFLFGAVRPRPCCSRTVIHAAVSARGFSKSIGRGAGSRRVRNMYMTPFSAPFGGFCPRPGPLCKGRAGRMLPVGFRDEAVFRFCIRHRAPWR